MAVTPNYSWPTPDNTDLVRDGAEAIRDLGDAIDATVFSIPTGGETLLASGNLTGASVNVTGIVGTDYNSISVYAEGIRVVSNANLLLRINSINTGYQQNLFQSNSSTNFNSTNVAQLLIVIAGTATGTNLVSHMWPSGIAAGSGRVAALSTHFSSRTSTVEWSMSTANAAAITSIQFDLSTSTYSGGTYRIYGVK
jgi:hypothetical protein